MEELFGKFRKDEEEAEEPVRKKKFKKNVGLEKPVPEKDEAVESLVERMKGASASAGRAKNRPKKRGRPFPFGKDEEEE